MEGFIRLTTLDGEIIMINAMRIVSIESNEYGGCIIYLSNGRTVEPKENFVEVTLKQLLAGR